MFYCKFYFTCDRSLTCSDYYKEHIQSGNNITFAVASMLTGVVGPTRVVVDRLLVVLHDEVWRKVSVLRGRKRIRSLLMRSSGQTGGAHRFVPRR